MGAAECCRVRLIIVWSPGFESVLKWKGGIHPVEENLIKTSLVTLDSDVGQWQIRKQLG